jgi:hypothetical protein
MFIHTQPHAGSPAGSGGDPLHDVDAGSGDDPLHDVDTNPYMMLTQTLT